ncbi:zinc finger protein 484-like isoform X2 [Sitophilus oryzae]|uniref:Zinc finger protein 484-like isoform X2 n=1 Tax=Sitophilus oryzae TaxID=7048 RepID=A0A6J2XVJ5_SITOR|nr:zinc finger protein 484-like isoform X2 [Sitophilus oryzae]
MNCAVRYCRNHTKMAKSPGKVISFHSFPKGDSQTTWLEALGIVGNWKWSKAKGVCSDHFKEDEFIMRVGKRCLKVNAVPSVKLSEDTVHKKTIMRKRKHYIRAKGLKESQKMVYRCSACSYQTTDSSNFNKHKIIHLTLEERRWFLCTPCGKKYLTKKSLRDHIYNDHTDSRTKEILKESQRKVYRCSTCSYQTLYKSYLNTHKKIHLALEKRRLFVCAHCNKKYMSKRTLRRHLHNNHTDSRAKGLKESQKKVYRCSTCSYQTPYKSHLNAHNNIHLPPEKQKLKKSHRCSTCSYQTPYKSHLNRHNNIHLPLEERQLKELQKQVYTCSICSYQTPCKSHFNTHKNTHLPPEERQLFAGAHCEKTYMSKIPLRDHLHNDHTYSRVKESQKKVYRCSTCGCKTPYKHYLNRHKKIHLALEERQLFARAHCDKTYMSTIPLRDHFHNDHTYSRNADEVILDSLKIEIDDHTPIKDEFKYAESATSEEKFECFLKIELDDVTPILNNDIHDDFKNAENLSVAEKVKLTDFIKMEPDDNSLFLDEDAFFKQENIHNF